MSAAEKLIKLYQDEPLLKGITLTSKNIKNAVFYVDELNNCKKCRGLEYCKNTICGIKPSFDGQNLSYTPCEYKQIEEKKNNVNTVFASNYLKEATLDNFDTSTLVREKAYQYASKFIESSKKFPQGLYIYGNFGTGKTYFLSALANELAQKGIKSILVFMPDLSRNLKNAMAENLLESRVNLLKNVDVLMLDDLGGEMISSWLRDEIIAPVIQYRMINNKPIFISSNLDYNLLREHFASIKDDVDNIKSNRILERIKQMTKRVCFDTKFQSKRPL